MARKRATPAAERARYRVRTGLTYPDPSGAGQRRAEPGEVVDDLPAVSLDWLLRDGHVEPVEEGDDGETH